MNVAALAQMCVLPVNKFDIGVALHQHKAAPVPQEGGQGRMRYPALDGAEPAITACVVHMFWNRAGESRCTVNSLKATAQHGHG